MFVDGILSNRAILCGLLSFGALVLLYRFGLDGDSRFGRVI